MVYLSVENDLVCMDNPFLMKYVQIYRPENVRTFKIFKPINLS